MSLRKYDGALGLLNAVLELDPNHSEAYRQRASVLRHRCRHKEAESDYNKFLELKPGTASVEKELAQLLQAQNALESAYTQSDAGEFSKVLEYVNKIVLVFSPGCLKAKLLNAKALLALKDYSNVISETGIILKEDEDNLDALLLHGRAYYYLADHDVANMHYQKGLRLDPEHSERKKAYFGFKKLLKKSILCTTYNFISGCVRLWLNLEEARRQSIAVQKHSTYMKNLLMLWHREVKLNF
uniref:Uncharacterized protein n=1 Tax=Hordeum vulgare subsp. vulgare TaxID=112509 RepID=A0A8I6YDK3_HORVV